MYQPWFLCNSGGGGGLGIWHFAPTNKINVSKNILELPSFTRDLYYNFQKYTFPIKGTLGLGCTALHSGGGWRVGWIQFPRCFSHARFAHLNSHLNSGDEENSTSLQVHTHIDSKPITSISGPIIGPGPMGSEDHLYRYTFPHSRPHTLGPSLPMRYMEITESHSVSSSGGVITSMVGSALVSWSIILQTYGVGISGEKK